MTTRNMKNWLEELKNAPTKKALPILSFPCISLLDIPVCELISDGATQAKGMQLIAEKVPSAASVSLMDLSVEAECFGANVHFQQNEVPTISGRMINDEDEADALEIPAVGTARTGIYIDAIKKSSIISYSRQALEAVHKDIELFAESEGLTAHANSIKVRFED